MASDAVKKINKINPEYNAIVVNVLSQEFEYNSNNEIAENMMNLKNIISGDHMVVLTYIKQDNLVLMVDPTLKTLGSKYYFKSFEKPNLTFEEIKRKYGIEAQQLALKDVRELEDEQNKEQKQNEGERETFLASVSVTNNVLKNLNDVKFKKSSKIDKDIEKCDIK